MLDAELDDLDRNIITLLSGRKHWPAKRVYSEISGFKHGKFGRKLILIRLKRLAKMGYLDMQMTPGSEELVFRTKKRMNITPL